LNAGKYSSDQPSVGGQQGGRAKVAFRDPPVAGAATILNAAYQDVMLWNGSFGNTPHGVNAGVAGVLEAGPLAILANAFGLSGLETDRVPRGRCKVP